MFFSVLTFTFSTGAQATKLLKSFFNKKVGVIVRENEVNFIISLEYKNVITINKGTCSRWDVLPELFNNKSQGSHIFTIDKIDHVVTAVQSMSKANAITIAFVCKWDTVVPNYKIATHLAANLRITNPKMVFAQACDVPHQLMLLSDELRPSITVNSVLAVQEYPIDTGHYLGMFAARRKINKGLLTQGICSLRFYVDGDVRSHISREPEVQRDESVFFNLTITSQVLQMLVAQCTIEKDAVASMKYVPNFIIATISCSSSFISSIFIPIDEDLNKFLSVAVGYMNDLAIIRRNNSEILLGFHDPLNVPKEQLSTFTTKQKLFEDCTMMNGVCSPFSHYIYNAFIQYNETNIQCTSFLETKIKLKREEEALSIKDDDF